MPADGFFNTNSPLEMVQPVAAALSEFFAEFYQLSLPFTSEVLDTSTFTLSEVLPAPGELL